MGFAIKVPVDIDSVVRQLSLKDKIELVRRLGRETRRERWSGLLSKLRKRTVNKRISIKEILACVREARREMHA